MTEHKLSTIQSFTHFTHRFFLPLLLASYVLAGYMPQIGLSLRQISFGSITLPALGQTNISPALVMLSFLLFNAGLGIKAKELLGLRKKPQLLLVGFLANMIVPILLILGLRGLMGLWHNSDELLNLLVGLALIIAMPIAGSSAAWARTPMET